MRARSSRITARASSPGTISVNSRANRSSTRRSASSAWSAPGYWTLTATARPSAVRARCTCPMLAAAAGTSSNSGSRARHCRPSCSSSTRCTSRAGSAGPWPAAGPARGGRARRARPASSTRRRPAPGRPSSRRRAAGRARRRAARRCAPSAAADTASASAPASRRPQPATARPVNASGRAAIRAVRAVVPRGRSPRGPSPPGVVHLRAHHRLRFPRRYLPDRMRTGHGVPDCPPRGVGGPGRDGSGACRPPGRIAVGASGCHVSVVGGQGRVRTVPSPVTGCSHRPPLDAQP